MNFVEGMIYQGSGFIRGYLGFEDGMVTEVGSGSVPSTIKDRSLAKGIVLPLLTNCHTHIGDAIARGRKLSNDVSELVAPPNGLKFRILRDSRPEELITSMHNAVIEMLDSGIGTFFDFREQGLHGIELLSESVKGLPCNTKIMGRPSKIEYSKSEVDLILKTADGIGISSISDWEYSELEKLAKATKQAGKLFALHASECKREDLDLILDLHPDFLVHMTYGSDNDYEILSEFGIPVVLCSRSNKFFNNIPNIPKMLAKDVTIVLGTDNAMINSCNLFDELKVAFILANNSGKVTPDTMVEMITCNTKKLLNPKDYINLTVGTPSNFMVIQKPLTNPAQSLVQGIAAKDIKFINIGSKVWKE
jgi:cytosine/adenosine deaminase-related metal-dependent hydrolase